MLPLVKPALLAIGVLSFVGNWNNFSGALSISITWKSSLSCSPSSSSSAPCRTRAALQLHDGHGHRHDHPHALALLCRTALFHRGHHGRWSQRLVGVLYDSLGYRYPVARLTAGGSYGNPDYFARTDAQSGLDGVWLAATNEWLCGGSPRPGARSAARARTARPWRPRRPSSGRATRRPRCRPRRDRAPDRLRALRRAARRGRPGLLRRWRSPPRPRWRGGARPGTSAGRRSISPVHYQAARTRPMAERLRQWQEGDALCAATVPTRYTRYDSTMGDPDEVRVLGGPLAPATSRPANRPRATYRLQVAAGARPRRSLAAQRGRRRGRRRARRAKRRGAALGRGAGRHDGRAWRRCWAPRPDRHPDPVINRGLQWAKANTIRVQHQYRKGWASPTTRRRTSSWCATAPGTGWGPIG